jgi:MFS family permease
MKEEGTHSTSPLRDSFGNWFNLKFVLLALFGLVMGQGVVWYTGQFYALFFLEKLMKLDGATANWLVMFSLLIATPFFVVFGAWSDKIGRKPIILAGCLLAALTYMPLFKALTAAVNPALAQAQISAPVTVVADPEKCALQFDPIGKAKFLQSCDIVKSYLSKNAINYTNVAAAPGTIATVRIGDTTITSFEGEALSGDALKEKKKTFEDEMKAALASHGYPEKADPAKVNKPMVIAILALLVLYVTMVYGPIAAALVEMFPTRIRYTSMSLPYHIGNGWFGGLLPSITFMIIASTGNIYQGLWYPIIIASITFVIGLLLVRETKDVDIHA